MAFTVLPQVSIEDALQETWSVRLDLMYQVSCRCDKRSDKDGYTTDRVPYPFILSGVHATCRQPTPTVLAGLIEECDSCEAWYIIRKRPDNDYLCPWCSGDA